jgi:hypothetical protein
MTGAPRITVSSPIVDEKDETVGVFGVGIKFEDWVKRAEDIAEATQILPLKKAIHTEESIRIIETAPSHLF